MDVLYTNRPTHSVLRNYRQIHYEKIDHAVVIVHLHTFPYCHALSRKIKANKYVNSDYTLEKIQIFKKSKRNVIVALVYSDICNLKIAVVTIDS